MEQSTEEWHLWRKSGVCASDSPVIAGLSEYQTCYELWEEKLGLRPTKTIDMAPMSRGSESERQLRARFSLETGLQYEPVCCASDKYPIILASLDAFAYPDHMAEMKYVGRSYFDSLLTQSDIKETHMIQMQHQMLAMEIPCMDYLATWDTINYKDIKVMSDPMMQVMIRMQAEEFWNHVLTRTPPAKTDRDWWEAEGMFLELLHGDMTKLDKAMIKANMPHSRMTAPGLRLVRASNGALRITKVRAEL